MARISNPVTSKFSAPVQVGPRDPPSLVHNAHRVSFQGVKRSGRDADHPPPSRAGVTENVIVSLAGIVGSNPAGSTCLGFSVVCWADHSSRGFLSSVVCLSVIVKPRK